MILQKKTTTNGRYGIQVILIIFIYIYILIVLKHSYISIYICHMWIILLICANNVSTSNDGIFYDILFFWQDS